MRTRLTIIGGASDASSGKDGTRNCVKMEGGAVGNDANNREAEPHPELPPPTKKKGGADASCSGSNAPMTNSSVSPTSGWEWSGDKRGLH